jgi:hypothetical protein
VRHRAQGSGVINTAYIERSNTCSRERKASAGAAPTRPEAGDVFDRHRLQLALHTLARTMASPVTMTQDPASAICYGGCL